MKIPFSKPTFGKEEEQAVIDCMRSGWVVLGPRTKQFEEEFAKYIGSDYAVFVDSGTAALFLAIKATGMDVWSKTMDISIKIPSLTFVSDVEVLHHMGVNYEFVDVNKDSLCVDEDHVGLIPTNFAGTRAKGRGLIIDSCHRISEGDLRGNPSVHCYSFYATKNLNTIQGGMIALNDKDKYDWLMRARDHGTDKGTAQRYKGKNPLYDVVFPGYRLKSDDVHATIGLEQLKKLPEMDLRRHNIVNRYNKNLGYNRKGNHLFPILVEERAKFIEMMYEKEIQTSVHFRPIHTLTAYKQDVDLPVTNYIGPRICSLPLFPDMTDEEVDIVSDAVLKTNLLII